ncbi:pentapeptide repeat-containing protein [Paenibacillus sp. 481]|uniref:pentapeptide repeat-containing protein n=1 Tax=Paenibacillus sp. 481 TaxID=2835869 RepID=UPI001E5CC6E9|nr:pentapeptide repeat-containing protein [Paenibacillus sp. 481]UHA73169.1 pentapeptide repeat-containing protein [Paenibacillus sp. 481]
MQESELSELKEVPAAPEGEDNERELHMASLRAALLQQVDAYWRSRMMSHTEELVGAFRIFCKRVMEQQALGHKAPIAYIHVSFLRSWLLQEKFMYSIEAYDDRWYLDAAECMHMYEMPWLYPFVQSFKQELTQTPLLRTLSETERDSIVIQHVAIIHQYVQEWIRVAVPQLIALPEFQAVKRADVLRIRTGEYKDYSEQVWMEDRLEKDVAACKSWLEQKLPAAYMCSDLRGLDLSEGQYEGIDLRYSHCVGSRLSGSNLRGSVCIGTDFSHGRLGGVNFSQSLLYDANFSGSDLSGAQFNEAIGGEPFFHEGMVLGFQRVDFTGANLQGASLLYADFQGADFRGANLTGAKLMKQDAHKWTLSEEQQRRVIWMEEGGNGIPVEIER